MTPGNGGRHCDHCEKTVIDFTSMTDRELVQFFIQAKDNGICGRFRSSQLDTDTVCAEPVTQSPFATLAKNIAEGILLLQILAVDARAQANKTPQMIVAGADSNNKQLVLRGRLLDHVTGAPIPNVGFTVEGTELSAITNEEGEFHIPFNDDLPDSFIVNVLDPEGDTTPTTAILSQTVQKADIIAGKRIVFYRYPAGDIEAVTVIQYKIPLINPYESRSKTAEEIIKMGGVQGVRIEPALREGPIKEKPQIRAAIEPLSAPQRKHWLKKLFGSNNNLQ